ncbi:MAG TPA: chaperone NapD [Xanthobacteraceae bacterium]|jgi:nitrate reductase NapD
MIDEPLPTDLPRREFINGRWLRQGSIERSPAAEIASILVQARPERIDAAALAIEALPGTQIYSRDPRGKLVVVIEASDVGRIGTTLNAISSMADVLSAALVFHATHAGSL